MRSPTAPVVIVTEPTFEPAAQVGVAEVVARLNCASVQPTSAPSLLIDGESDTPVGSVTST